MRDYVQAIIAHTEFAGNVQWQIEETVEDMQTFNPDGIIDGPRYFYMVKANFVNLLRLAIIPLMDAQPATSPGRGADGLTFLDSLGYSTPNSPRGLPFTDADGKVHEPTPSEKPVKAGQSAGSSGGTFRINLRSYLLLLLNTWQGGGRLKSGQFIVTPAPQRWQEWLIQLLLHYDRYTPTQIYGFLALVDFTKPTFKV